VATLVTVVACGGGEEAPPADTPAAAPPATPTMSGSFDASTITPEMVALGDSVFHGQAAGGICQTCHGPDAKGLAGLAPDLTDTTWINTDGSWEGIATIVQSGVPQPKQHPAPMLPMGGANLTPDQIRAVSAYVYRLSHPM
jgi:mono/diheme cytochrome c family protein